MTLDETLTPLTVGRSEIERAHLARQPPQPLALCFLRPSGDLRITLPLRVQPESKRPSIASSSPSTRGGEPAAALASARISRAAALSSVGSTDKRRRSYAK